MTVISQTFLLVYNIGLKFTIDFVDRGEGHRRRGNRGVYRGGTGG